MKNLSHLDKAFDQAVERLDPRRHAISDPYGGSPLASDHDLLKKGWAYFHERLQIENEQWKKIVEAKDAQINVLSEQVEVLSSQLENLLKKENDDSSVKDLVTDLHLGEYVDVRNRTEKLKQQWEEERQLWIERCERLEVKLKNTLEEAQSISAQSAFREEELRTRVRLTEENASQKIAEAISSHKNFLDVIKSKDSDLSDIQSKSTLLQAHIDRIMSQLKEQEAEKAKVVDDLRQSVDKIQTLSDRLLERDREIEHLKMSLEIKDKEISVLRSDMNRQHSEWREWWSRIQNKNNS